MAKGRYFDLYWGLGGPKYFLATRKKPVGPYLSTPTIEKVLREVFPGEEELNPDHWKIVPVTRRLSSRKESPEELFQGDSDPDWPAVRANTLR